MAQQIFAYITHADGKADDSALELVTAAREIDPDAAVTAVVAGSGDSLDAVCKEAAASY
ncbi:MAG: electron transfer flavoprotein subunit alpha/FixB family protein, partial [Desulfobacterales bacterium]|nr:electron transfer flavoprotein subunit alpha/FixB family protein [Desulfobacterales bacterium]